MITIPRTSFLLLHAITTDLVSVMVGEGYLKITDSILDLVELGTQG